MFGGYAGVWYRDFPKYCVQDAEKIWTHEKEDSSSCVAAIYSELRGSFMAQCREMLVWVDETGSDSGANARRYG